MIAIAPTAASVADAGVTAAPELTDDNAIRVTIDLRVKSPNGLMGAEHFRSRHNRRLFERRSVRHALAGRRVPPGPWLVVWTRVGARAFDADDNLNASLKSPRDEVADWLGVNDSDPCVTWLYQQRVERVEMTPQERLKERRPKGAKPHMWKSWVELTIVGAALGRVGMRCAEPGQLVPASCAKGWIAPTCPTGERARAKATRRALKAGGYWGDGPAT